MMRAIELPGAVATLARWTPPLIAAYMTGEPHPAVRERMMIAVARMNRCRHCTFVHTAWADAVDSGDAPAADDAIAYATGRVASGYADGRQIRPRLEAITRSIDFTNRINNRADAFLFRLAGTPIPSSHVVDEVVMFALFLAAMSPALMGVSLLRRAGPTAVVRDFVDRFTRGGVHQAEVRWSPSGR